MEQPQTHVVDSWHMSMCMNLTHVVLGQI